LEQSISLCKVYVLRLLFPSLPPDGLIRHNRRFLKKDSTSKVDHINNSSNPHLHNGILKYGLSSFAFVILEYCISSDLLKREQHFLDILFSLAKELRYNFNPTADSRLGATHTPESKAKTSDSISGANNPMYGRTGANHPMFGRTGANNPMYGKVPATAMTVNVYSLDNVLEYSFSSQVAAAEWLGVSRTTVQNYVRSGKVFNNQYRITKSTSSK